MARLDLGTDEQTVAVDATAFRERHDGAWVSRLLGADDDGGSLLCVMAANQVVPTTDETIQTVAKYFGARLDLATGDFEHLASLNNPFF